MDYASMVDDLLSKHDLGNEAGRREAYERCEKYATEHIGGRAEFNAFMEVVGAKLHLPPTRRSSLDDDDGEPSENAKIHLKYAPQVGPELAVNAEGLQYLIAVLAELGKQADDDDHIHLYAGEPPMYGDSYPLTVYYEPDAWFEKWHSGAMEDRQVSTVPKRDVDMSEIAALCVLSETPPGMRLAKHRLYRVLSAEAYDGRKVWEKRIREGRERFVLVTAAVSDSVEETFGFDLDDPEVLFFTREDVARLSSDAS